MKVTKRPGRPKRHNIGVQVISALATTAAPSDFCDLELPRESHRAMGRELGPHKQCPLTVSNLSLEPVQDTRIRLSIIQERAGQKWLALSHIVLRWYGLSSGTGAGWFENWGADRLYTVM